MKPIYRAILFWFFAIAFLISAPLLVLYTAGYRYQFGSTTGVFKTGVLTINSTPRGATVFVDGNRIDEKTPVVIDNLVPGNVRVRIEKDGYTDWEKTLKVESGKSTLVQNLVLFFKDNPSVIIDSTSIKHTIPYQATRLAYEKQMNGAQEVWVRDSSFLEDRRVFVSQTQSKNTLKIDWSPDGEYLLIMRDGIYTIVRFRDRSVVPMKITKGSAVSWDVGMEHTLIAQQNGTLNAFGIDTNVVFPVPLKAQSARHHNGRVMTVQSNQQSTVSYLDNEGLATIIAYLPLGAYEFIPSPNGLVALKEKTRRHLLVLDPSKQEPLVFNEEALLSTWSDDGRRLVFSSGFDIKMWDVADNAIETITRFSEPIKELGWYPLGSVVLYRQGGVVNALELDARDHRNKTVLVDLPSIETFWVSKDGGSVFFVREGKVWEKKVQK